MRRIARDARQHARDQHADQDAQRRQRTLVGDPGDARHHQRERDGEPAFLQRHGSASARAATAPVAKIASAAALPGRGSRWPSVSVASANSAASTGRCRRTAALARICRCDSRARPGSRAARTPRPPPTARHHAAASSGPGRGSRRRRTARRGRRRARDASVEHVLRLRHRAGAWAGWHHRCSTLRPTRLQEHQRDHHARQRHGGGRGFAAPRDRDDGSGERRRR